jgi:hypothetical protein
MCGGGGGGALVLIAPLVNCISFLLGFSGGTGFSQATCTAETKARREPYKKTRHGVWLYIFLTTGDFLRPTTGDNHGHAHSKTTCANCNHSQLVFLVAGIFAM